MNNLKNVSPEILEQIVKLLEQDKNKEPKKPNRVGRPSKLTTQEKEWLLSYLDIDPSEYDPDELRILLSNHRGRPMRLLGQRIQKLGNPIYTKDIFRKEISFRFGIACVFDDVANKRLIVEFIAISNGTYSPSYEYKYDVSNKQSLIKKAEKLIAEIDLDKNASNNPFNGVKDYLDAAKDFKKNKFVNRDAVPNRVGFALAVAFINKGYTEKNENELQDFDYVCQSLRNRELPPDKQDFDYQEYCDDCVESFVYNVRTGAFVGKTTMSTKAAKLALAIDCYRRKLGLKYYPAEIDKILQASIDVKIRKFKDVLPKKKNHPPLILSDIKSILDMASNLKTPNLYFRILLQLSTGLRVIDIPKLCKEHLLSTGQLCYNQIVSGQPDYLVTKTEDKVDPSELVNPTTSIVTRIILKYFDHQISESDADKFWFCRSTVRQNLTSKDAYERTLRTTCATYLMWASTSDNFKKISYLDVQNRMAHINSSMITEVYAKNRPKDYDDKTVDEYLDTPCIEIDGKDLSQYENAWDLWLLGDLISKLGKDKIKPLVTAEIKSKEMYKPRKVSI
jgi:hypothetical protein